MLERRSRFRLFLRHESVSEALAFLGAALLSLPVLSWPFQQDQSIFATIADTMLHGGVLYRDAWEHKPPGVFCTYYLAFLALGKDLWSVQVLEILAVAAASAGLFRLGVERLGSRVSGLASALALPLAYLSWRSSPSQPETFAFPFIIWGFAFQPPQERTASAGRRCFASGLLFSVAVLYKTPMILAPMAAVAERLLLDRPQLGWKQKLGNVALTLLGLVPLPLGILLYVAARGCFPEFLDANLYFPAKYAAPSIGGTSLSGHAAAFGWLTWLVPIPGLLLLALGIGRGLILRPVETARWGVAFLAAWVGVVLQAKYWPYHHLLLLPSLAWGYGLAFMSEPNAGPPAAESRYRVLRTLTWAASFAAGLTLVGYAYSVRGEWSSLPRPATVQPSIDPRGPQPEQSPESRVARFLRTRTSSDDRIFVWGDRAVLYVLSDRRMAGPYPHLLPVLAWFLKSESKNRLDHLVERLGRERPRYIVVCPGQLWWYGAHEAREIFDDFPGMKRFLVDCYILSDRLEGYEMWKLRD